MLFFNFEPKKKKKKSEIRGLLKLNKGTEHMNRVTDDGGLKYTQQSEFC